MGKSAARAAQPYRLRDIGLKKISRHFDDLIHVGDEDAVGWFWFDDMTAGEGAEGGEGQGVFLEVEAGEV